MLAVRSYWIPLVMDKLTSRMTLAQGPGQSAGGRIGKALWIEVVECELVIKIDLTGRSVRTLHGRIGEGGIAGADLELRGGNGG